MTQRVLTRAQVRQFDKIAIDQFGIESLVLMENAARGATDVLCECAAGNSAVILCGPGNNGGDGLVMARHLHLRGWKTKVLLLANSEKLSPDSTANLRILSKTGVPILEAALLDDAGLENELTDFDWTIDAMLGTGASPPLREPFARLAEIANRTECKRMAVDISSGLDCDSDLVNGAVFAAHLTATFVALKPVMLTDTGKTYCGETRIVDIGAPPEIFELVNGDQFHSGESSESC